MNTRTYKNEEITAYLLGNLPETETEFFDELSFTDDNFADTLKSAEKDLVDAYVRGELAGETLEKFNNYYLSSPIRREKVNFAKAFQDFAEQNTKNFTEEFKPKRTIASLFSSLNIFKNLTPVMQFGFAAVILALVVLGSLWVISNRLNQQNTNLEAKKDSTEPREKELPNQSKETPTNTNSEIEVVAANTEKQSPIRKSDKDSTKKPVVDEPTPKSIQTPSIIAFILAPPTRSSTQIPSLLIPKQTNLVSMKLQLDANDYPVYQITLVNQSNQTLWTSGKLKATNKGANSVLNFPIPAKLLKSQIYSLVVSGILATNESEIISYYPFRAVIK